MDTLVMDVIKLAPFSGIMRIMSLFSRDNDAFKLYEVVNYFSEVPFPSVYFSISMNKKRWNSLSKDIQDAVMKVSALEGAKFWGHNFFDTAKQVVVNDIKNSGKKFNFYSLPTQERDRWL